MRGAQEIQQVGKRSKNDACVAHICWYDSVVLALVSALSRLTVCLYDRRRVCDIVTIAENRYYAIREKSCWVVAGDCGHAVVRITAC